MFEGEVVFAPQNERSAPAARDNERHHGREATPMEEPQATSPLRAPDQNARASLLAALTEAVRDRDQRGLRRLLARFAEQVTITDLHALRDAIDPRRHRGRPPEPR